MSLLVLKLAHTVDLLLPLLDLLFKFFSPLYDLQLFILAIVILSLKPSGLEGNENESILLLPLPQLLFMFSDPSIDLHLAIVSFITLVFFLDLQHVLLLNVVELELHLGDLLAM